MRLDHLLSREPTCGKQLVCLPVGVGVLVVFLCLHVFTARPWVVGVGALLGLGIRSLTSRHTVGFTFNTVLASAASCGGGCPHDQPERVFFWVWVVCGGLFVICIVVASIFVLYCFLCFV